MTQLLVPEGMDSKAWGSNAVGSGVVSVCMAEYEEVTKIRHAGVGPMLTCHGLPVAPDGTLAIALVEALRSLVYDSMFSIKQDSVLKLRYIAVSRTIFEAYECFLATSDHFIVLDGHGNVPSDLTLYFKGVLVKVHQVSDYKIYTVIY